MIKSELQNKRKNKSESNIISKLDNIDTSDWFSNDTIEGTSDEYNNYEIVRGTKSGYTIEGVSLDKVAKSVNKILEESVYDKRCVV